MPDTNSSNQGKGTAALLLQIMAVFWLLAKAIGWKVWVKERIFPVAPLFQWFDWPSWMHYCLFLLSVVLLVLLIIKPLNRIALVSLAATEIISCLADQNRWQPWEYQYVFTTFIFLFNKSNYQKIIVGVVFIMSATYLYSGMGKLNEGFLTVVWENMFLKRFLHLDLATVQQGIVHYSGYVPAVIEMLFGTGLLFFRTQKISAWGLIIMHLLLLFIFGPFGLKYNIVVWPWNMLMIAVLHIIFIKNNSKYPVIPDLLKGWNKIILFCWGILPALNYWGLWDNYLSSRLYSEVLPEMAFCIKNSDEIKSLTLYISKKDNYQLCSGVALVNVQKWAMEEMKVPPYPEIRVYKKIAQEWSKRYKGSNTLFLYYRLVKAREIIYLPEE